MEFTLRDIARAAREVIGRMADHRIVAFYGPMGAGKTTLIRQICSRLGVQQEVTSPTFALVNRYTAADGRTIDHFDLYRIERIEELYDMGYEEYFYSDDICLIEWPERGEALLPDDALRVHIEVVDADRRRLRFQSAM